MYKSEFEATLCGNEILLKHRNLLEILSDDRIMCVGYEPYGKFYIEECCDEYFWHYLTKEECIELSELFKEVAETIGT